MTKALSAPLHLSRGNGALRAGLGQVGAIEAFARPFLAPGIGHCEGGATPTRFAMVGTITA
jgi:hypothetical protein